MGHSHKAECRECGAKFEVDHGDGSDFHLLHCDKCGQTKNVRFASIRQLHGRYVKRLGPRRAGPAQYRKWVADDSAPDSISKKEYLAAVEKVAGRCWCGGSYKFAAPPRCPKCRSLRLKVGAITVTYD